MNAIEMRTSLTGAAIRSASIVSLSVSLISISGYLFGVPRVWDWGGPIGMAFPTALAVGINSICLYIIGSLLSRSGCLKGHFH